jgi:hypothetical protein
MADAVNACDEFVRHVTESLGDGSFVRLVLSRGVDAEDAPEKVIGRLVELKAGPHLSLTFRYPTRDTTKNVPLAQVASWAKEQIRVRFRSALLNSTKRDWQLFVNDLETAQLVAHKPSKLETPSRRHDQSRQKILDESARDWLQGLGILNNRGNVRPALADKHAQINRFLEIFTHLATDAGWLKDENTCPTITDMGCGKGYLTFAVWHLFARAWKRPVTVIGVEARQELVASANALAQQIGAERLKFIAGTIDNVTLPKLDGLIALHACDTATDDAIRRGVESGARLIIVAPCCHKQIRPQLGCPPPLAAVLEHGIMTERLAEWATDGLRALFLQWAGYRVKIIEFVSTEHTPKNLMIAAVRHATPFASATARARVEQFREFCGIQRHALDDWLRHGLAKH